MARPTIYTIQQMQSFVMNGNWERRAYADYWDDRARELPDREALSDTTSRLTWEEVKNQSDNIAMNFLKMGIDKDQVILVQIPEMVEFFTLAVASAKAGVLRCVCPRTLRHAEIEHIAKLTKAVAVAIPMGFSAFDYLAMIKEIQTRVPTLKYVLVPGDPAPAGTISIREMSRGAFSGNIGSAFEERKFGPFEVYTLRMTTGTTGFPKFHEICVGQYMASAKVLAERVKLTEDDVWGAISPLSGGPNSLAGHAIPRVGAKMAILMHWDPLAALEFIGREKVTVAGVTPTQLVKMLGLREIDDYEFGSLRAILSGGATLPATIARRVEEKFGCAIVSMLGSSEAMVAMTCVEDPPEVRWHTLGKPFSGNEIQLVDDGQGDNAERTGEIAVRGIHVCTGYYNDPEATWQAWTKDGWVHTGDLGRIDESGNLIFIGRKKEVIIRGGQNIYPGEVENLLRAHSKVYEACVIGFSDATMGERACAFVIAEPGKDFTFEEMIRFLEEKRIAKYKFPERLEVVEGFPMHTNGKVDKRALQKLVVASA